MTVAPIEEKDKQSPIRMLISQEQVQGTYRELLEDVVVDPNAKEKPYCLTRIEQALGTTREDMHYSISLYNRNQDQFAHHSLDDHIAETMGSSLYTSEQSVRGQNMSVKTLELYVQMAEAGGR